MQISLKPVDYFKLLVVYKEKLPDFSNLIVVFKGMQKYVRI